MRKFVINVNGKSYEVEVEEVKDGSVAASAPVVTAAPAAAPKPAAAPVPAAQPAPAKQEAPKSAGKAGSVKITAPMPGNILDIKVNPGDTVKKGDPLLILEAMKMENEIMAPQDGKVASINTSKGAIVNSGDLLVTME